MYLQNLSLNNFRSFCRSEIPLCEDLTILVGENNGGKSNAIDAIRLLTAPLGGRRELYCEATDIRFGSDERKFELTATFTELNPAQQGRMISAATDAAISGCVFGLKYDETTGRFPVRPVLWGGHQQGNPEPGCHEMVRHVYLPPLRDAKRALASGNPTRIYALLNHFLEGEKPEALAKALRHGVESEILGRVGGAVEVGLSAIKAEPEKLRLFRSAVFVPIDGVDFEPYAKLLLSPYNEVRIADRLVVLTDGDGGEVAEGAMTPGAGRKRDLQAVAGKLGASDLLEVVINDYSLETELVRAGNGGFERAERPLATSVSRRKSDVGQLRQCDVENLVGSTHRQRLGRKRRAPVFLRCQSAISRSFQFPLCKISIPSTPRTSR